MSTASRRVFLLASFAVTAMLASTYSRPGAAVSDRLAAELRGGCAGAQKATCTDTSTCSDNGYKEGGSDRYQLDGESTTYCKKTANGQTVCNDSMQTYKDCGS